MKVADAITYCLQYHKINSRPTTLANYKFLLKKFGKSYNDRTIERWPRLFEQPFPVL